jgi:hypothetical protein
MSLGGYHLLLYARCPRSPKALNERTLSRGLPEAVIYKL